MMDHGKIGPPGLLGGGTGACNEIEVCQAGRVTRPEHISKGDGYELKPGDWVQVRTPGGGGYGDPAARDPMARAQDRRRDYLTAEQAARDYGERAAE
jgi:N-methylhydantoinase B